MKELSTCGLAGDLLDQLHLLRAQCVEDGLHIGGLHAGLEDRPAAGRRHGRKVRRSSA